MYFSPLCWLECKNLQTFLTFPKPKTTKKDRMSLFLLLSLLLVSYLIPHKYQVHSQYSFPPVIMEINSKKAFKAKVIRNDTLSKIYKHGNTLEQLDLSGCGIRKLPENLFNCLQNLKIIDLRQNFFILLAHEHNDILTC